MCRESHTNPTTIHCFFFNDTATTEIYTLSLHDALPILRVLDHPHLVRLDPLPVDRDAEARSLRHRQDRKSTRLNSSHANISYAVFCLKKNKHSCITKCLLPARPCTLTPPTHPLISPPSL